MAKGNWRAWAGQLIYRRPYEDTWGILHDPTTEWDELFKYYRSWVQLLVDEGTRLMARPASAGACALIRGREERRWRTIDELEASYLEWSNRRKQWGRRQKRKARARAQVQAETGSAQGP